VLSANFYSKGIRTIKSIYQGKNVPYFLCAAASKVSKKNEQRKKPGQLVEKFSRAAGEPKREFHT
jgi:hypothetical protein